jgi:DNA polymerase-1
VFLGKYENISREGLNMPIQSTAADVMNYAIIRLFEALPKVAPGAQVVNCVYDSLLVEAPAEYVDIVIATMRAAMEAPVDLWGKSVRLPVDFKVGESWGEMSDVEG